MAITNYDEWNIDTKPNGIRPFNERSNAFLFLSCSLILVSLSIVNIYSITFPSALMGGLPSFYYAFRYLLLVLAAAIVGVIVYFLPVSIIRTASMFLAALSVIILWINALLPHPVSISETAAGFVFSTTGLYISSYFARKKNCLDQLRFLTLPVFVSVLTYWPVLLSSGITWAFLYVLVLVFVFLQGGTGLKGVFILFMYLSVPTACYLFSSQSSLNEFFAFFLNPGTSSAFQKSLRLDCIAGSSLTGSGIGLGLYKTSGLENMSGLFPLCNIADEAGYLGIALILIVFILAFISVFRSAQNKSGHDMYCANSIRLLFMMILGQLALNVIQTLDLTSFNAMSCPFFSYSLTTALNLVQVSVIYKLMTAAGPSVAGDEKEGFRYSDDVVFEGGRR